VQRSAALRLLSPAHRDIVILSEQGVDAAGIAERLSLDISAVGPALEVARAKLAALEAREEPARARPTEGIDR
jgi:DNA-directed RNA polymerase specialized sigma24 family protein